MPTCPPHGAARIIADIEPVVFSDTPSDTSSDIPSGVLSVSGAQDDHPPARPLFSAAE